MANKRNFNLYVDSDNLQDLITSLKKITEQLKQGYKEGYTENDTYYNLQEGD